MSLIQKLRSLLTKRDKKILIAIIITTMLNSILEVAALSSVMIFISSVINFKTLHTNKYITYLFKYTGPLTNTQIILTFGFMLIFFYIFRCIASFSYIYGLQKFIEKRRHVLAYRFFQNYLRFNYKEFTTKNPASIHKLIFNDSTNVTNIISASIKIFSELLTISIIYLSLVVINWKMTLALTFIMCANVTFLIKTFSSKLARHGAKVTKHFRNIGKIYNESFRNFKMIKLLGHEKYILSRFQKEDESAIKSQVMNSVLQETPRLFLETIGFIILSSAVMYVVYKIKTPEYVIPILSMYALAFYRFLPSISKVTNSYNQIMFAKGTLDPANDLMYKSEELGNKNIEFKNQIFLKNVSFRYEKNKEILSNVTLKIKKQERIAFIGESGAGKSTLADIIMGFYIPKEGELFIDDQKITTENIKSWRNKIGYIPQQIYLFDGTVAENIVFGRKYSEKKIINVLKKANIYNFLMHENGIHTKVGEGGVRLSGGQMQRIAIARALYSDPEILVLDEATSALDNETETNIMDEIYKLDQDKTLIIIAHRLSTVLKCEKVYKLKKNNLELVNKQQLHQQYISLSTKTDTKQQTI